MSRMPTGAAGVIFGVVGNLSACGRVWRSMNIACHKLLRIGFTSGAYAWLVPLALSMMWLSGCVVAEQRPVHRVRVVEPMGPPPPTVVVVEPARPQTTVIVEPMPAPTTVVRETVIVNLPPPKPRIEVIMVRPSPRHVWISGYWVFRGGRHVWVDGHWELPPRGRNVWVSPRWEARGGGHVFIEGFWR